MRSPAEREERIFTFGMVLSMFSWGLTWTSGKIISTYGGAIEISEFRFFMTFVSLFLLLILFKQELKVDKKGWPLLVISSILISFYYYFFFKGLEVGKAGAGGVLVTTLNPVISYALMLVIQKRKPLQAEAIGLFTGFVAGCILLKVWQEQESVFDSGNLFFLLASLSWAILSIFTAKSSKYGSPVSFSLWMYGLCCIIMFFVADPGKSMALLKKADGIFWGNMFFIATLTTSLATTFFFVATAKIGAGKASSFIFLVPFTAAIGSWLFLGETIEINTIAGGILGIVAVYMINKKGIPAKT